MTAGGEGAAGGGLLVTGTDTGVGKTVVAAAIVAALRSSGRSVVAWKPVESGVSSSGGVPADAALLARCAGLTSWEPANTYALSAPLAPVLAARLEGVLLDPAVLDRRRAQWGALIAASPGAVLVVEGAGGALVELAPGLFVADLPARWGLAAVVVAANRLGVLNHGLLTVEALRHRGADVRAVVLVAPEDPSDPCTPLNAAELRRLLAPLPVLDFPRVSAPADPAALARAGAPLLAPLLGFPP